MAKLPEAVKTEIDKAATVCVATADKNAVANVIYVSLLNIGNEGILELQAMVSGTMGRGIY